MDTSHLSPHSLPYDTVIPPNFASRREPGALSEIPSLQLNTRDALRNTRSFTSSSAVSEAMSCVSFYSALGTSTWKGKFDEDTHPSQHEQRQLNSYEEMRFVRSDSGYASNDSPVDGHEETYGDGSGPRDSSDKLTEAPFNLSEQPKPATPEASARTSHRRSGTSDVSDSRERKRRDSDPVKGKSSRQSEPTRRRSSVKDSTAKTGSDRPTSKHSSKSLKGVSSASRTKPRPTIPARSSSSTFPRRKQDGSVAAQNSCHMFQSLGATLALSDVAYNVPRSAIPSAPVPPRRHSTSAARGIVFPLPDLSYAMDTEAEQRPPETVTVVPCTVIDWKSPTTRRREYAEIDRRERGLRGWWNRWSPSWCNKSSRYGFYDGEDDSSDQGSVRRYRLELPDEEKSVTTKDTSSGKLKFPWPKQRGAWSCFNLREEPSGPWLSGVALSKNGNSPINQTAWGRLDEKRNDEKAFQESIPVGHA